MDALDSVVANTKLPDRASALSVAQLTADVEPGQVAPDMEPTGYRAEWVESDVTGLAREARSLATARDLPEAFARFSDVEERMEPIKHEISALAAHVDEAIQCEIDRMRGK